MLARMLFTQAGAISAAAVNSMRTSERGSRETPARVINARASERGSPNRTGAARARSIRYPAPTISSVAANTSPAARNVTVV